MSIALVEDQSLPAEELDRGARTTESIQSPSPVTQTTPLSNYTRRMSFHGYSERSWFIQCATFLRLAHFAVSPIVDSSLPIATEADQPELFTIVQAEADQMCRTTCGT